MKVISVVEVIISLTVHVSLLATDLDFLMDTVTMDIGEDIEMVVDLDVGDNGITEDGADTIMVLDIAQHPVVIKTLSNRNRKVKTDYFTLRMRCYEHSSHFAKSWLEEKPVKSFTLNSLFLCTISIGKLFWKT